MAILNNKEALEKQVQEKSNRERLERQMDRIEAQRMIQGANQEMDIENNKK
jgi:hypothetical protein